MGIFRRKKPRPEETITSSLILVFTLAVGLLVGVIFGEAAFWCRAPECKPRAAALMQDPEKGQTQEIADVGTECVPALVRDDTKEGDVFTQMTDKALEVKAKVTTADRWFSVDATGSVASLTMTFNPPLVVTPGAPVPVPQPVWDRATVRTSATIVCTVLENGQCTPSVRPDAIASWGAVNGAASLGVRAEYDNPRFDEVRVHFDTKAAIDGGRVSGTGLFPNPPGGSITFDKNDKTVAPAMGEARWHCVWVL